MADSFELIKLEGYSDFRGSLKKIFLRRMLEQDKTVGEVYVLYTRTGCIRGNHYHKKNLEYFAVLGGTATIALQDTQMSEPVLFRLCAEDDIVIRVPSLVAHSFRNDEKEELVMLAVATEQYDPEENDTYTCKLL